MNTQSTADTALARLYEKIAHIAGISVEAARSEMAPDVTAVVAAVENHVLALAGNECLRVKSEHCDYDMEEAIAERIAKWCASQRKGSCSAWVPRETT